jgi:hypothetical protein
VGLAYILLLPEYADPDVDGSGLIYAEGYVPLPWGVKGLPEGTDNRLLGVRGSQLIDRGIATGDCIDPAEKRGLLVLPENVAEVGVLYPPGDWLVAV